MTTVIRINSDTRGRYAVLVNGAVLLRCRTKTERRSLVRASADPGNPYKAIARRWRRK